MRIRRGATRNVRSELARLLSHPTPRIDSNGNMRFTGRLPWSGPYEIRISLERDAVRRNETAYYRLDIRLAGTGGPTQRSEEDVAGATSPEGNVARGQRRTEGDGITARSWSESLGSSRHYKCLEISEGLLDLYGLAASKVEVE